MIYSKTMDRFTVETGKWLAMTLVKSEPPSTAHSPIFVHRVEPQKTGSGLCKITFFHANDPEGVQAKSFLLKTRERNHKHWIAKIEDHTERQVRIEALTSSWLITRFPETFGNHSPGFDAQQAMNKLYPQAETKSDS